MGKKRQKVDLCVICGKSKQPAISAAKLGHESCLVTAYRVLGIFNERDDYGATPIHYAARNGRRECLEWLVKNSGISPNAVARNGATAAHDAAALGHIDCLMYLLEKTHCSVKDRSVEGATVLHMACRFGRAESVKWLLSNGSEPSEKGANDVTPVHLCAAKNHLDCLKHLSRHRSYVPNERTSHGASPIYFAAQEGSLQCLKWLFNEAGGDLYMTAVDGMSPIHAAAQSGQLRCLTWLVNTAGVPIRYKAVDGATPVHFAAASGQVECLNWLLDNGGSAIDRDNLGGTPVHDAAEQGQVEALSSMIQRGVNIVVEDYDGLLPFDLAKDNKHQECMKLLFKAVKTNILTSLTPRHSLSRASQCSNDDDDQPNNFKEKQRQFEEAMLAGISEEKQEAMWENALFNNQMQPGLKLLLKGGVPAHDPLSEVSLTAADSDMQLVPEPVITSLSTHSSLRHSHRSYKQPSQMTDGSSLRSELVRNHPTKTRPLLDPTLFLKPKLEEEPDDDNWVLAKRSSLENIVDPELQPQEKEVPSKMSFLKRLKFKKKFLSKSNKGKKHATPSRTKGHSEEVMEAAPLTDPEITDNEEEFDENPDLTELPAAVNIQLNIPDKKLASSYAEEAVITHKKDTKNTLTPSEEVAVAFQAKTSITKESFHFTTNQQLLSEIDLSSAESTDIEDERVEEKESLHVQIEALDKKDFNSFGQALGAESNSTLEPNSNRGSEAEIVTERVGQSPQMAMKSQSELSSLSSGSTVIVHENVDAVPDQKPSVDALLKEVAPVAGHREHKPDGSDVKDELDVLHEARGVERLISQMKGKKNGDASSPAAAPCSEADTNLFKKGGIGARLRMFENQALNGSSESSLKDEPESNNEAQDIVAPLRSIKPGIAKSFSSERLRIDGRSPELTRKTAVADEYSSPSLVKKMATVYSPLMVSNDAGSAQGSFDQISRKESEDRSHSMTLYMNSANLAPLNDTKKQLDENEKELAEQTIAALTEVPNVSGESMFANLSLDPGVLMSWEVKNHLLEPFDSQCSFNSASTYICLEVCHNGPDLYHIHQWSGQEASSSGDHHCDQLYRCLPGRPVIHRHLENHETPHFRHIFKSVLPKSDQIVPYYNTALKETRLYRHSIKCHSLCVFSDVGCSWTGEWCEVTVAQKSLQSAPCVLDTGGGVWVWLPEEHWSLTSLAASLSLATSYLEHQKYPQWTPVTVVTQRAEPEQFCGHFPSWDQPNLSLSEDASKLRIPEMKFPSPPLSATGQTKVWTLESSGNKQKVPLDLFGHFFSDQTYLIEYTSGRQKSRDSYVWVGEDVYDKLNAVTMATMIITGESAPSTVTIVPQGKETDALLNLFKGKFIIHKTLFMIKPVHLYCVSGDKPMSMKATEVAPKSTNLSSCHSFVIKTSKLSYMWSGQFSSKSERRATSVFAKVLSKESELVPLCEGLETPQLWSLLGGKQAYPHHERAQPTSRPHLFYCGVKNSPVVWVEDLARSPLTGPAKCSLLHWGDQLVLVWDKKALSTYNLTLTKLIQNFISQHQSHKTLTNFVITMAQRGQDYINHVFDVAAELEHGKPYTFIAEQKEMVEEPITTVEEIRPMLDEPNTMKDESRTTIEVTNSKEELLVENPNIEEKEEVPLREAPVTNRIPLTISQEAVFADVQKLQQELEMSLLQELAQEDSGPAEYRKSKLRMTSTIDQLTDMIDELDSMKSSTPPTHPHSAAAAAAEALPHSSAASSEQLPSSRKGKKQRSKPEAKPIKNSVKSQKMITLTIEVEEVNKKVEVVMREDAPVISAIYRAADKAAILPQLTHALYEVVEHLGIERALEDHESVVMVTNQWPTKNQPRLVLKQYPDKYLLLTTQSPLSKETTLSFIKEGQLPDISSNLHYCKHSTAKPKWHQTQFCLAALGIYYITKEKRSSRLDLVAGTDHCLYTAIDPGRLLGSKKQEPPSTHVFIMKPQYCWKQKDLKLFCAEDQTLLSTWMCAIRLAKYGLQLKVNYQAMKTRLQKRRTHT